MKNITQDLINSRPAPRMRYFVSVVSVPALAFGLLGLGVAGCGSDSDLPAGGQVEEAPAEEVEAGEAIPDEVQQALDGSAPYETVIAFRKARAGADACRYLSEPGRGQFGAAGVPSCDVNALLAYGIQSGGDALIPISTSERVAVLRAPCEAIYTLSRPTSGEPWRIDRVEDVSDQPPCV